jgi:hypothetical protein
MYRPDPVDAVAPNPKTGDFVWLRGQRYLRGPLEIAWLNLSEHGGDRFPALREVDHALSDWHTGTPGEYVTAAESWTGNVAAGEVA